MDRLQSTARATFTIKIADHPFTIEVDDCTVCLGGEFAGNVDLLIRCGASESKLLGENLALVIPGESEPVDALGWGPEGESFSFTFGTMQLADVGAVPDHITVLCEDVEVAELPIRLVGSVPLEESRFTNPTDFLNGQPPSFAEFSIGGRRGLMFAAMGVITIGLGLALASGSIASNGFEMAPRYLGFGFMLFSTLSFVAMWVPESQIRFDPARGVVSEVRGRFLTVVKDTLETTSREISEFSHVRIIERIRSDSSEGSQSVWFLLLEGPIRWTDEHGVVHSRSDSIKLTERSSQPAANRLAARIASPFGLKVLDTTDTGM